MFSAFFPPENRTVYGKMWKIVIKPGQARDDIIVIQPGRPEMTQYVSERWDLHGV